MQGFWKNPNPKIDAITKQAKFVEEAINLEHEWQDENEFHHMIISETMTLIKKIKEGL